MCEHGADHALHVDVHEMADRDARQDRHAVEHALRWLSLQRTGCCLSSSEYLFRKRNARLTVPEHSCLVRCARSQRGSSERHSLLDTNADPCGLAFNKERRVPMRSLTKHLVQIRADTYGVLFGQANKREPVSPGPTSCKAHSVFHCPSMHAERVTATLPRHLPRCVIPSNSSLDSDTTESSELPRL